MAFENDARVSSALKFTDRTARLSTQTLAISSTHHTMRTLLIALLALWQSVSIAQGTVTIETKTASKAELLVQERLSAVGAIRLHQSHA